MKSTYNRDPALVAAPHEYLVSGRPKTPPAPATVTAQESPTPSGADSAPAPTKAVCKAIRLEVDDDSAVAARLRSLCDSLKQARDGAKERLDAQTSEERGDLEPPPALEDEDVWERALLGGAVALESADGQAPNSVLNLGLERGITYRKGACINVSGVLPVGCQVLTGEASKRDAEHWDVSVFCFGSMSLIGYCSSMVVVPLSTFLYITRRDLLSVFAGKRTIVDVKVHLSLVCRTDGVTFDGYRLLCCQEAQVCQITARLQEVPCDHPEEQVRKIVYVDAPPRSHPLSRLTFGSSALVPNPENAVRYRCMRCKKEVVKL